MQFRQSLFLVLAMLGWAPLAAQASFAVSQPDLPNCTKGQVRQIGAGKGKVMASASAGAIPLDVATQLILPGGWSARIGSALSAAPVQWKAGDTWVQALTSASEGCYAVDWNRHVFEAVINPQEAAHGYLDHGVRSVFVLTPGSLRHQVEQWASAEGRRVSWLGPDYHVSQRMVLTGTLEDAVRQAFARLDLSGGAGVNLSGSDANLLAVQVTPPPPAQFTLRLAPGSLRDQLGKWAKSNGMQLAWRATHDYLLGATANYAGTLNAILSSLADDFTASDVPLVIRFKEANQTIVVEPR